VRYRKKETRRRNNTGSVPSEAPGTESGTACEDRGGTHVEQEARHGHQHGESGHAPHPAQVGGLQEEESSPAQLFERVRRVAHVVQPLVLQRLDHAAPQVAELVEAELAVIAAHATVSCGDQGHRSV